MEPQRLVIAGPDYRATFHRYQCQWQVELRDTRGQWRPVTEGRSQPELAVVDHAGVHGSLGSPARLRHAMRDDAVLVGLTTVLRTVPPTIVRADAICTADGLLIRCRPQGGDLDKSRVCWSLPRLALDDRLLDAYAYWREPDELRSGRIADLGEPATYVGVSAWGRQGDTAPRLSRRHPAVVLRSQAAGMAFGAVFPDYEACWKSSQSFLQHHMPGRLFFYPAVRPIGSDAQDAWAWLAPMPVDPAGAAKKVERLLEAARGLTSRFESLAPEPDEFWTRPLPEFQAELRRSSPVDDIRLAVVYTVNEPIHSQYGIDSAKATGSDVLIRGWFKWHTAPDWSKYAALVPEAHRMGALFGGGITCSALYHGENGLTESQVLDMATRGSEGQLVDAWHEAGCRHGTLSNRAYLEYLASWCQRQIDAGADYLFMDEINAALQADEGFDDYSTADFRKFLLEKYGQQGWTATDARWRQEFNIALSDHEVARDGTMATFQYRAYLKALGLCAKPHGTGNPLAPDWHAFREDRDRQAWKWLSDAVRGYAASHGRRVLLSGNGLARYVDLQVLGVWDKWLTREGRVDLSESQIDEWASTVAAGWGLAEKRVPVVLFHDWGFGGFPWMEVSPEERRLWMRVRGAEIYAAGGFFAFPVNGPQGNDARHDGTLAEIARQSAFYHRHQDLYLDAELVGFEPLETSTSGLSLALWRQPTPPSLVLHVINRLAKETEPVRRGPVTVSIPVDRLPQDVRVVSPDWPGEKRGEATLRGGRLSVTVPELEAYSVAILSYAALPELSLTGRRITPQRQWGRPVRNEFQVRRGGLVTDAWALPGLLQGMLHRQLRNPPSFVVNMPRGGSLRVHVRTVATQGARLQWRVDGRVTTTVDLPDRDRKNDSQAREYDRTYELPIPPGRHRVALDNIGGDWVALDWYAFSGESEDP
jgi:hypothetical protein